MDSIQDCLKTLDLGKSVAEFDEELEQYFVETNAFEQLLAGKCDIIAGDKGTGKTALYRILQKKSGQLASFSGVSLLSAFNLAGSSIFKQLTDTKPLSGDEYGDLWKAFLASFVGNWFLDRPNCVRTDLGERLERSLRGLDLRTTENSPGSAFGRVLQKIGKMFQWRSADFGCTIADSGLPMFTAKVGIGENSQAVDPEHLPLPAVAVLRLLNECLKEAEIKVWVALDRLDEAFPGHSDTETQALKALLQTYLDITDLQNIKLKLFLRRDLFSRVTSSGFVNLTHVNAMKHEIVWLEDDLRNLLCKRIRKNVEFCSALGIAGATDIEMFDALFPEKVDPGSRRPKTWTWMMERIRDGNDVRPPRNLIDLTQFALNAQLRKEIIVARAIQARPIIQSAVLREGLSQLSKQRVNDTIIAEAGSAEAIIQRFRGGKAEHSAETIARLLGIPADTVPATVAPLVALGFLENTGSSYKVPSLYREGMRITQGKATSAT